MKLAIISDIHANLEALTATLADISARGADRIVCLGDIVGYNANPAECVALLREFDPVCVAGNHDRAVAGVIATDGFPHTAMRAVKWTRNHLDADALDYLALLPLTAHVEDQLVAVHGALHPPTGQDMVRLDSEQARRASFEALARHPSRARILAFGHTHHVGIFELKHGAMRERRGDKVFLHDDAYYLVNPGAVGQSRTADMRATYLVLDTEHQAVTVNRVAYDADAAALKTRRAGLMPAFSFLPAPVRDTLKRGVRAVGLSDVVKRLAG